MRQTEGELITLDWYDGPLCQLQRIDFADHEPLVQVRSRGYAAGTHPHEELDGKPVKGCDE